MRHQIKYYIIISVLAIVLGSCASKEKLVYFQEIEGVKLADSLLLIEPTIQIGDLLDINVSAIDAEAALPFNLYETPVMGNSMSNSKPKLYLVNAKGDINFPVIGKLKVEGLTTIEISDTLEVILKEYIKKPIINIQLTNFKVSVMGEVNKPGTYTIPNERISILQAITMAGDLTIHGERKNVKLIREQNGKRVIVKLDLTNELLFSSPYFYLAQNDMIYVEPNKTKVNSSAVGSNTGVIISSISILISLVAILIN